MFLQEKNSLLSAETLLAPAQSARKGAGMSLKYDSTPRPDALHTPLPLVHSPLRSFEIFFSWKVGRSPAILLKKRVASSFNKKNFPHSRSGDTLSPLLTINFLKKERLYTKLKYSRSPAYDIVSGGSAALLAGFIGFLIQEKYGFELVDSGDFYYLFMYAVFAAFSLRPLLISVDLKYNFSQVVSLKLFVDFYLTLLYLFFYSFKS
tara:strand:+ start:5085 stop:5702 length:618 start_codon:yes stop_codon:yes gene_type:complete